MSAQQEHPATVCIVLTDGRRCGKPVEYVPEGDAPVSGWYHTDRALTADHHAVPTGWV